MSTASMAVAFSLLTGTLGPAPVAETTVDGSRSLSTQTSASQTSASQIIGPEPTAPDRTAPERPTPSTEAPAAPTPGTETAGPETLAPERPTPHLSSGPTAPVADDVVTKVPSTAGETPDADGATDGPGTPALDPVVEAPTDLARAASIQTAPTAQQAKIVVRAGGDRLAGGVVAGLAGVRFEFHRVWRETDLSDGRYVAGCTTGTDGRCGVIVDVPSSAGGYFYAKQVSAPHGWSPGTSWGTGTDVIRHNTGWVTASQTVSLPRDGRLWPNVRTNPPPVAPTCEAAGTLDVGFVIDLSNSTNRYTTASAFHTYKEQATALVDRLQGTPTTLSVYTFATAAPSAGGANGTLGPMSVRTATGAETVRTKIRGLTATPEVSQGYANWDEGLAQVIGRGHDVVVLLTDGEPTAHRAKLDGDPVDLAKVAEAVHSANGVKSGGTQIVVVGVNDAASPANQQRLALLSGTSSVTTTAHLTQAGGILRTTAASLLRAVLADCAGTLTVTTRLEGGGGSVRASGWALTAGAAGGASVAPRQATTNTDGAASFTIAGYTSRVQRVTITQTQQAGFAMTRGAHATCVTDGVALPVSNTDGGFAVDVPTSAVVACTVSNRRIATDYAPGATEAKVVVRAGGDRAPDGSVTGLPGASFDLYRAPFATALDGGTRVGTCTTGDDGTCAVVVSLAQPTTGAAFYGVQTTASSGWTLAERWGDDDDLVRYSTGRIPGGRTASLPDDTRRWPQLRTNPELPARCGLDVALVYDLSNSVARPGWPHAASFAEYKRAGTGVVDALEGTPSRLAVYTYATDAPAAGPRNETVELTPVARPTGADAVRHAISGLTATPQAAAGFTNWDEALAQLPTDLDVVVFLTDGEPTDSRSTRREHVGFDATLLAVEEAIHSANSVKAGGAHLLTVGAGPAHTAANQQRLRLLSEDVVVSDFAGLGDVLKTFALAGCVGTVNIVKDVIDLPGGEPVPGGDGWAFVPHAAGPGAGLEPATTGDDGTVSFVVDLSRQAPGTRTVTITEAPRAGYAIAPHQGSNAACTATDGVPVTVTNVTDGFTVEARHDAVVTCRVINAAVPRPDVTIVKTAAIDPGGGLLPTVLTGTDVTWFYTVTNTGNVPLTEVHVTDDRGVAVTCPAPGTGSHDRTDGLAPGQRLTCFATGPVTPLPTPHGAANERT